MNADTVHAPVLGIATPARSSAFAHSPFSGPGFRNRWKMRPASPNAAAVNLPCKASRSRLRKRWALLGVDHALPPLYPHPKLLHVAGIEWVILFSTWCRTDA